MVKAFAHYIVPLFFLVGCQHYSIEAEKNKLKAQYHLELANNLLNAGRNPAAIEELQNAINLDPTNPEAHHKMALSLYQRLRYTQALDHFKQSLLYDKKNTQVRVDMVLLLLEQKNYTEAFKHAEIAVNDLTYSYPAKSHYLMALASLPLSQSKDHYKAVAKKSLITTLNYSPKHCGALFQLGKFYESEKQPKKAFVLYRRSLKSCQLAHDKALALNELIPLSKQLGLVYQWKRFNQLKQKLAKKTLTPPES